jgi:hypothetical protein
MLPEIPESHYFIMKTAAEINTAGCKDFYGKRFHSIWDHPSRIAAYWLRQANMSVSVAGITADQMDIYDTYGPTTYAGGEGCGARSSTGQYAVEDVFQGSVDVVGNWGSTDGLNFDVSCNVTANFGTIPLRPRGWGPEPQNNSAGNPGTPYALPSWQVNIPFAPTAAPSLSLTSLSPTSGSVGTPVTLTGTDLSAATTVNFGGSQITNFSYNANTQAILVTASTGSGTVDVSVSNASSLSNAFQFTYTQ